MNTFLISDSMAKLGLVSNFDNTLSLSIHDHEDIFHLPITNHRDHIKQLVLIDTKDFNIPHDYNTKDVTVLVYNTKNRLVYASNTLQESNTEVVFSLDRPIRGEVHLFPKIMNRDIDLTALSFNVNGLTDLTENVSDSFYGKDINGNIGFTLNSNSFKHLNNVNNSYELGFMSYDSDDIINVTFNDTIGHIISVELLSGNVAETFKPHISDLNKLFMFNGAIRTEEFISYENLNLVINVKPEYSSEIYLKVITLEKSYKIIRIR